MKIYIFITWHFKERKEDFYLVLFQFVFQEEKEIIFWVNLCPLKEPHLFHELEEETVDGF